MSIERLGAVVSITCPQLGGEYAVNWVFESGPLRGRLCFFLLQY